MINKYKKPEDCKIYDKNHTEAFLSLGQYDLWLEHKLYPLDISNHFHFVAKINNELNPEFLQQSIYLLAESYEVIRTVFPIVDEKPVRKLLCSDSVKLHIKKCFDLSESEIKELIQKEFEKPFDLTKDIPFRFFLYQKSLSKYYLQIVSHHIAITLNGYVELPIKLAEIYQKLKNGQGFFSKGLTPYSEFVQDQYNKLNNSSFDEDKKYWSNYLKNVASPALPLDVRSSNHTKFHSKAYYCELSNSLAGELQKISQQNKISFFSVMTAAFQVLQYKYTKQKELIIGIPTDEIKMNQNYNNLIGYTVNTLPLYSTILPDESFSQFIKNIGDDIKNMSQHRLYPLSMIKSDLRETKNNTIESLFKVLVVSQKTNKNKEMLSFGIGRDNVILNIDGFKYESTKIGCLPTGRFDLALAIIETENKYVVSFHYNTGIYEEIDIKRLLNNYLKLLQSIVANPDEKIEDLEFVSDQEDNLQRYAWNNTKKEFQQKRSFLELFEDQAKTNPENIAVIFDNKSVSYNTLNCLANKLANYLIKMGVKKGSLIGLGLHRSIDLIISLLGILKAGCAYLPIDPNHPKERIQTILKDSSADILITHKSLKNIFNGYHGKKVFLDLDKKVISQQNSNNLDIELENNRLSYVIYTSGSTGKPKGVEIGYEALNNFLLSMQEIFKLSSKDRCLALTTISFDISNLEILLPLSYGAKLILATNEAIKDPSLLVQLINKYGITLLQATPSTWEMLVDFGWKGSDILTILCGGESLSNTLANKLVKLSKVLWNMYGPTETTIWSSMKKIESTHQKITIGKPIFNTTFYILDEKMKILPIGAIGELYIGGAGLARCYHNAPELTSIKFIKDPFSKGLNDRLYKTGDLVRYLSNGEIEYLDRIDNQIKIRGYRIELGEIEETIKRVKGIKQAIVVVQKTKLEDKRLIAYLIGNANEFEIKEILQQKLPSYMIPSSFVKLDKYPLSPNGKIDRKALSQQQVIQDDFEYLPPENPIQNEVAKIFQELFGIEKISICSNFFALGGHSLLGARIITRINNKFHINLPFKTIFEKPTISLISKEVNKFRKKCSLSQEKSMKEKHIELSPVQKRFWFLEQQNPNTSIHNIPFILEFTGKISKTYLEKAINCIINRHQILRTIFKEEKQRIVQNILPKKKYKLHFEDLHDIIENNSDALILDFANKPFNLSKGPLFNFLLLRVEKEKYQLLCNFHHIIFDGYSTNIFINELKFLYEKKQLKKNTALEKLKIQYKDYSFKENLAYSKKTTKKQINWWVDKLKNAPYLLNLSTDKPRPLSPKNIGDLYEFTIAENHDLKALKSLACNNECTLFALMLTVFHILLSRYTSENDIIIGIPVSGRTSSDLENMIGCFINILPVRTRSNSQDTFLKLLLAIKNELLDSLKNQNAPFEKIVENLKIKRSPGISPIFQVALNMLPKIEHNDFKMTFRSINRGMAHFDLDLTLQETSKGLIGVFEYNSEIFFKKTIKLMSKYFKRIVHEILKDPKQNIYNLPILSKEEIKKSIITWNKQHVIYSSNTTIFQLIDQNIKNIPNNIAVICKDKSYTYFQLNCETNKIANTLLKLGLKKEEKVVVFLDRSIEFIPTILGIMKAGGVYIPLDTTVPNKRLNLLIKDLQPFCILTHSSLKSYFSHLKFCTIIYIDNLSDTNINSPNISISKNQLAYIIYTSGSTSMPKGVEIEHKSICDRVLWKKKTYPLDFNDAVLLTYSFIFDGSIINYFWPLCTGSRLIIATKNEQIDSSALIELIQKHNITTVDLLPSILQNLLQEKELARCRSLKYVFSGGEALFGKTVQLFYKKCSGILYNTYGPTEATVEASVWQCPKNFKAPIAYIGKSIAGAKLLILDNHKNIVPVGVPGELYIGGTGLARGYHKDQRLTEKKFIKNPFSKNTNERLYSTGDLVKYHYNGVIEYLGRIDNQVKLRGFRIELKEIEFFLSKMNLVNKAIVKVQGNSLHKILVAYVVLTQIIDEELLNKSIKTYLKNFLPEYMIPQKIVILDKLPTLPNGKINYNALPEVNLKKESKNLKFNNQIERELYKIWQKILGFSFNITDNFFEIGGNSLLAMRLIAKIKQHLNISIPVIHLFQNPTIETLAQSISTQNIKKSYSPIVKIKAHGHKTPFFWVHPLGGNVISYKTLAKFWDKDRPFYAFQAQGIEENEKPYSCIKLMAKNYIIAMQKIQPKGPYFIGGWSFGGLVGAEMAHQLESRNEKVSMLTLIDTTANLEQYRKINANNESVLLSELTRHFKAKPLIGNLSFKEQFINFIENGCNHTINYKDTSVADRLIEVTKAHFRALKKFSIPYLRNVNIILIRSRENLEKTKTLGWDKYTAHLKVFDAPGCHWAITQEEHAKYYSNILQTHIEKFSKNFNF